MSHRDTQSVTLSLSLSLLTSSVSQELSKPMQVYSMYSIYSTVCILCCLSLHVAVHHSCGSLTFSTLHSKIPNSPSLPPSLPLSLPPSLPPSLSPSLPPSPPSLQHLSLHQELVREVLESVSAPASVPRPVLQLLKKKPKSIKFYEPSFDNVLVKHTLILATSCVVVQI